MHLRPGHTCVHAQMDIWRIATSIYDHGRTNNNSKAHSLEAVQIFAETCAAALLYPIAGSNPAGARIGPRTGRARARAPGAAAAPPGTGPRPPRHADRA